MSDKPRQSADIRDFRGIELGADDYDLAPEKAADQVNIQCDQGGSMRVRMGTRQVTFDA